jgi:Secretion system C-terminal sorting domain
LFYGNIFNLIRSRKLESMVQRITSLFCLLLLSSISWSQCADPTSLNGSSKTDSLLLNWSFTQVNPATPSTGFQVQYGMFGFVLGQGTILTVDNNFTDTVVSTSFMAGGVYEVYVKAVCGTTSSNYAGPFTITMPLDNDAVCKAELLQVNNTVYTFDNTGASTSALEQTKLVIPETGYATSLNPETGWGQDSLSHTTWFKFVAPASGKIHYYGGNQPNALSQVAIYSAFDCANYNVFQLKAAADQLDPLTHEKVTPDFTVCGLVPGQLYYIMHDLWKDTILGEITGKHSIRLTEVTLQAGLYDGLLKVCTGDTVNLFDGITNYPSGGMWRAHLPVVQTGVQDSLLISGGLGYGVNYLLEYRIDFGCAFDTVNAKVRIYPFSNAGDDGLLNACKNETINLFEALSGLVDMNGTWYNALNQPLASNMVQVSSIGGGYNYDYIVSNGVCPEDTSNILVYVDPSCTASVDELFASVSIYPNPFTNWVHFTGLSAELELRIVDMQGKLIADLNNNLSSELTLDLSNLQDGIYIVQITNEFGSTTHKLIKGN